MSRYIPLNEYTEKYKVSFQEIRKRIELKQVEFIFSNSEYLIKDKPFEQQYQLEKVNFAVLNEAEEIKELTRKVNEAFGKLEKIQQENVDLKNLCEFLEVENKKLKEIILGNQRMDEWFRTHS